MQNPWLAYAIDRNAATPVFEQICARLRADIVDGRLAEGSRLPATRNFATELGVSRSTIVTAYDQLQAEGYITGRGGSGYTVCPLGDVELTSADVAPAPDDLPPPAPGPVPVFTPGQPDMRLFPYTQWAKTVARVCRTTPEAMLTGGTMQGNFALRQAIARHLSEWRGIEASAHQVIVTAGSGDALEICLRTLLRAGEGIGLEDPGYQALYHFADGQRLPVSPLGRDSYGTSLPRDPARTTLAVLTPSHQFPLGGAMSPGRRMEYIQWAADNDCWIIEDDYDSEFRYAGRPIPALAGFDRLRRTLYVGSFSKIFSNSLRLGYVVIPEALRPAFDDTLARYGIKASFMPQQALAEFINRGEFYRHLRRVRRIYGERRRLLIALLDRHFADLGRFEDHQAGMQIAWHLPPGLPDREIAARARAAGLGAQPLSAYCRERRDMNGLLLGFCGFTEEELAAGMAKMRENEILG